jgi:hypothetical protein
VVEMHNFINWGVYEFSGGAVLPATPFRIIDKSIGTFS